MATGKRTQAVQVPGETSQVIEPTGSDPEDQECDQEQPEVDQQPEEENPDPVVEITPQRIPDRSRYANMRADEVDPTKIKTSALTKDGWVVPQTQEKKA